MGKFKTIDEYIKAQPAEVASRLTTIRELFHKTLPDTQESIRYDIPAFAVGKDHLYMSGYKNHIGFYPMYGLEKLDDKMQPYRGRGTKDALHFKHSEPLPLNLIKEIIIAKSKS